MEGYTQLPAPVSVAGSLQQEVPQQVPGAEKPSSFLGKRAAALLDTPNILSPEKRRHYEHIGLKHFLQVKPQSKPDSAEPLQPVDSPEGVKYLLQRKALEVSELVKLTPYPVLQEAINPGLARCCPNQLGKLPEELITMDAALAAIVEDEKSFLWLPETIKADREFQTQAVEANPAVLNIILANYPDYPLDNPYQLLKGAKLTRYANVVLEKFQYDELRELHQHTLDYFDAIVHIPHVQQHPGFEKLCEEVLVKDGRLIQHIPVNLITDSMVQAAFRSSFIPGIASIPEPFQTLERCRIAIERGTVTDATLSSKHANNLLSRFPELLESCKKIPRWLRAVAPEERTADLCRDYLERFPEDIKPVPKEVWGQLGPLNLKKRQFDPEQPPSLFTHKNRDLKTCEHAVGDQGLLANMAEVPENLVPQMPPIARLCRAPWSLPEEQKQLILEKQDAVGLFTLNKQTVGISPEELLRPVHRARDLGAYSVSGMTPDGPELLALRVADKVMKRLMVCQPFQLRHQKAGDQLESHIQQHCQTVADRICNNNMAFRTEKVAKNDWVVYGGRTIRSHTRHPCTRLKFRRRNENFRDFVREEAVHQFCSDKEAAYPWRSEIPKSCGLQLMATELLDDDIHSQFRSELETLEINGKNYYLIYQFTTEDEHYSTLAHQPDSKADNPCQRSGTGLLKACYDLGLWSSFGFVHDSTAQLFHVIGGRRELFLPYLFNLNSSVES